MRKNWLAGLIAAVVGFTALGLAPAYAVDERVIDVVEVTWAGAPAPCLLYTSDAADE